MPRFFKGKRSRFSSWATRPGGGVDAEARLLAKYLERHLPGNPAVTVRNMPGAAGWFAANWFEQFAKPDGLQLLLRQLDEYRRTGFCSR